MNAKEFVAALRLVACDNVTKGVLKAIKTPPGRQPDSALIAVSDWFNAAGPRAQDSVKEAVSLTAQQAVYNVLLVLDGLLSVSMSDAQVDFEVIAKERGERELLNDPTREPLTWLFKENNPTVD